MKERKSPLTNKQGETINNHSLVFEGVAIHGYSVPSSPFSSHLTPYGVSAHTI